MTSIASPRLALLVLIFQAPQLLANPVVTTIDEIQVTATRRPTAEENVSAALTIVSGEEIWDNKLTTDALAMQPGVYLQQTTPGQGAVIIRGLKGSELLHLVDGFRLNNAIFRNAPTQYLALVAPGGVERIEVVRGALTSLYGSDAMGGVVHVLSHLPDFDSAATEIRGNAYAAYGTAELDKVLRGSLEVGNRDIAGIVSAEYLRTGDRRIGSGERIGPTGYESKGGRLALSMTPDSGNTWLFDLQFARQPSTPRIDELVAGFGQSEPSSSEFRFAPNERYFAHIRHTRPASLFAADWTVDAGWQRIVDDRISRNYQAIVRRYEENSSDLFGLTINASKGTAWGSWIVGAEFYHDIVASRRVEENLVDGSRQETVSRFPDGSTLDQAAIFANLMRRLGGRHTLSGGVRLSRVAVDLPQTPMATSATSVRDVSADLGYLFDLSDHLALTANLARGFRAPNIFDIGTLGERPGNRFNIPNPGLQSEHVTQIDLGFRQLGERWQGSISFYGLRFTNRIASIFTGDVTADGRDVVQSRNIAEAKIYGVEAALDWSISDRISTRIVANLTRGEQTEADAGVVPADRIPPLNGRMALRYEGSDQWYVEPYIEFASLQTRLSPRDARDVRINPDGTTGWGTLNVRAQWLPWPDWRLGLAVENLLDKQYRVHGSGLDAAGRNLGVSVRFSW